MSTLERQRRLMQAVRVIESAPILDPFADEDDFEGYQSYSDLPDQNGVVATHMRKSYGLYTVQFGYPQREGQLKRDYVTVERDNRFGDLQNPELHVSWWSSSTSDRGPGALQRMTACMDAALRYCEREEVTT